MEGLGLALNNIENDIMKQIVKVHSERERQHEEAHNAREQAFYQGVCHSILQAYASQEWLSNHQNLDDLLPDDDAHHVRISSNLHYCCNAAFRTRRGEKLLALILMILVH